MFAESVFYRRIHDALVYSSGARRRATCFREVKMMTRIGRLCDIEPTGHETDEVV